MFSCLTVVTDTGQKKISPIIVKSIHILLALNLLNRFFRRNVSFYFYNDRRHIRILLAGNKDQFCFSVTAITLLIADGVAFCPEIIRIMKMIHRRDNITLYPPESFE